MQALCILGVFIFMFEDMTRSIKASLYERVSSPLFGAFLVSWSLWNYKVILIIFSSLPVIEKIDHLEGITVYKDTFDFVTCGFVYPLFSSLLFIFLYPFPAKIIYGYWNRKQKELKELKQKIEDETPLTIEESRRIRRNAMRLEVEFEEELNRKEEELNKLKELIQTLQSKESEVQIKTTGKSRDETVVFNDEQLSVIAYIAGKGGTVLDQEYLRDIKLDVVKAKYYLEDLESKKYIRRDYRAGAHHSDLTTLGKKLAIEKSFVQ